MGIIIPTWQKLLLSFSCSVVSDPLSLHGLQHARLPRPSLSLRACSHSCPLSQWCHKLDLASHSSAQIFLLFSLLTSPFHGSQPCRGEVACVSQWSYEPCHARPHKMYNSEWRVLTKHGPLEEGMANHSSILAARTPWTIWKGTKYMTLEDEPCRWKVSSMLLGKSRGQLLITLERRKRLSQSRNDAQLWTFLVVKVKFSAEKNNLA